MRGLMMDYQLTLPAIMRRAEKLSGSREIVSRRADRSIHRYSYAEMIRRAKQLAIALQTMGVAPGDRIATLSWNHHRHLEAYFAIPSIYAVLHTLNLRLHPNEIAYIINHAEDRVLLVDETLLPLWEQVRDQVNVERVIVMGSGPGGRDGVLDYEDLISTVDPVHFQYPDPNEHDAAALCYTSGTTGRSRGVLYSHRAIVLFATQWSAADSVAVRQRDVILGAPPMFHINGWSIPFTSALVGSKLVLPHRHLDPPSLLELIEAERVTLGAGVPTVWIGVLQALNAEPGAHDVSSLKRIASGGSAIPKGLMREWLERFDVPMLHLWGMTELTGAGTVGVLPAEFEDAPPEEQLQCRVKQGVPMPFVEIRARGDAGEVAWDGQTMGELEVRGPVVASGYFNNADTSMWTHDGWLRTGDIATIDARGCVELRDRSKDLIKSGGEWISSVALENALMGHPAVAEAAVIAVPHPKWDERPLACVVVKPGQSVSVEELRTHLAADFSKWSLPDAFEFVAEIPRTSTGKFLKTALRERYRAVFSQ
jgi:fatty-acyl-CoA synthase